MVPGTLFVISISKSLLFPFTHNRTYPMALITVIHLISVVTLLIGAVIIIAFFLKGRSKRSD